MKKYILLFIVVAALAFSSYATEKSFLKQTAIAQTEPGSPIEEVSASSAHGTPVRLSSHEATPRGIEVKPRSTRQNVTLSVSLSAQTSVSKYEAYAPTGETVLDVMRTLASSPGFTFAGRDYPSLGFFVESVNGKKSADGYNWFLYINGKTSDTGASQTLLHTGDIVEWRYEKNY